MMHEIRLRQALAAREDHSLPPRHRPEMLYIGCIDARLDPIDDIGIEKGKAVIFRNIGAQVLPDISGREVAEGELPPNVGVAAALEFFLHHIPGEGRVKHIVIAGHTDCGGIKACLQGACCAHDHYLPLYLRNFDGVRGKILAEAARRGWSEEEALKALEEESVRWSLENLQTYPAVRRAMEEGRLEVHGWIINTATQRIFEMNPRSGAFEPMGA